MAAVWQPLVFPAFDYQPSDNPPKRQLRLRTRCDGIDPKFFRRPHTLSWERKAFHGL